MSNLLIHTLCFPGKKPALFLSLSAICIFLMVPLLNAQDRGRVYTPDQFLRGGYFQYTIDLENNRSEELKATLVSKRPRRPGNTAILYIHGYLDYFFQPELGDAMIADGYTFYALDLRRHGRSWTDGQILAYSSNFSEFFEEIEKAIEIIADEGHDQIVLMGHSTGGLIAASFMNESPKSEMVDLLILNSPFLAFNFGEKKGGFSLAMARLAGTIVPRRELGPSLSPLYGMSIHESHYGEWPFDTIVKPIQAPRVRAGWIKAANKSQRKLLRRSAISVPVLVLHSDHSVTGDVWSDDFLKGDAVLNVDHIRDLSPGLGDQVELIEIEGALHDVFLSKGKIRQTAIIATRAWISAHVE